MSIGFIESFLHGELTGSIVVQKLKFMTGPDLRKISMMRNRKFSNLLETIDTTSQSVTTFSTGYDVGRVN